MPRAFFCLEGIGKKYIFVSCMFRGKFILFAAAAFLAGSCASSRYLSEGEYKLARNVVNIQDEPSISTSELATYLKQQPASFNLFGNVPTVFDSTLLKPSCQAISSHLDYLGYYGSKVDAKVEKKGRKAVVVYDVVPAQRYKIKEINYILPDNPEFVREFFADSLSFSVKPGDWLSEASLEKESERSAAYFRNLGYYGFTKNYYFFEADTLGTEATLDMSIKEYTRNEAPSAAQPIHKSTFGDVSISYPKRLPFKNAVLEGLNTIKPGNLYEEETVKTTYQRMSSLKVFNSVGIELTQRDSALVDCAINLSPSRLQGFKANFEASSNSTGLMGISPQVSYYHKNIFHGGEWLNLGFMGNFQFRFDDSGVHSNEFGISAGISFPKFLGLPYRLFNGPSIPRTDLNFSYNYQDRPEYLRNILSFSFGYSGTYKDFLTYQLYPLQLNLVRLYGLDEEFSKTLESNPFMRYSYQNHFDSGIGCNLFFNPPTASGNKYLRFSCDLSGNFLSLFKNMMNTDADGNSIIAGMPYTQYARTEITLGRTWKTGEKSSLASRVLAGVGYAYGNSSALPFEKQFYCGGANSMRGWQARSLGPGRAPLNPSFIIPSQTGDLKFEANLEYRQKMFWKLEGALFIDAGNVWSLQGDDELSLFRGESFKESIAADWGAGLRVDLNFLIVRVDMGLKLYDPSRVAEERWLGPAKWFGHDGFALHFGVGYPF